MRRSLTLLTVVLAGSGCGSFQPYKAVATTSKAAPDVFGCALGVATSLDYAPDQVSKDSGFFKAGHSYHAGWGPH